MIPDLADVDQSSPLKRRRESEDQRDPKDPKHNGDPKRPRRLSMLNGSVTIYKSEAGAQQVGASST